MNLELPSDSPWRRLPAAMSRRQVLYFDGLRLSVQMAVISLRELEHTLTGLMALDAEGEVGDGAALALTHAYGVVDAVHRFREILRVLPGLKKRELFKLFMSRTEPVEEARNHVQHLNQELEAIGEQRAAALGCLTWTSPDPHGSAPPTAWVLVPGSFYHDQIAIGPTMDLATAEQGAGIIDLTLQVGAHSARLRDLVIEIRGALDGLEPSLRAIGRNDELLGSDVIIQFSLTPVASDVDHPPAAG